MNPDNEKQEQLTAEFETDKMSSIDDFLKELEEKEKDLNMSSEVVIEVDDDVAPEDDFPEFLIVDSLKVNQPEKNPPPSNPVSAIEQNSGSEVPQLRRQIGELENECKDLKTALHRRQTDFDSYRKRIERERGDAFLDQVGNLATQLLPVLDNLNRALEAAANLSGDQSKNFQHLFDGIVLVNQQLNEVLAEMGVEPITAIGESFDPHFHDAVAAEESEVYSPHTITAEFLRGYRIGEKVIRPAMVKVASAPNPNTLSVSDEAE